MMVGEVKKMQQMFSAGCSPAIYQQQGKSYDFPDLSTELCPQCKADHLSKHGFYTRNLITIEFDGEVLIRRYRCPECKKTVSLLPSFCHPKRTYGILAIFRLLAEFYIKIKSVCLTVTSFLVATDIECSRQLLLLYRRRIEKNLNSLVMAVTDIYGLRAPPVTEKTNIREKVRQLLTYIKSPQDDSLKIFKRTRTTYLTPQAI
jgi:predicted Zn-ribbon and HTH transcriptional regulator